MPLPPRLHPAIAHSDAVSLYGHHGYSVRGTRAVNDRLSRRWLFSDAFGEPCYSPLSTESVNQMSSKQKIANIQKQIEDAHALFEALKPGRGAKLLAHIRKLETQLKVEQGHVISKFHRQRLVIVSGAFSPKNS